MKNRFWARCLRSVPPSCEWRWCEKRTSPFHSSHGLWTRGRLGDGRWLGRQGNWKQTPRILSFLLFFYINNLTVACTSSILDIWARLLAIRVEITNSCLHSGISVYTTIHRSQWFNPPSLDCRVYGSNDLRHWNKMHPLGESSLPWIPWTWPPSNQRFHFCKILMTCRQKQHTVYRGTKNEVSK